MDRAKFFAAAKTSVFGGKFTQAQVDGIDAILDACVAEGVTDGRHVAYILATPMIETGGTFVPIKESLNYSSDALTAKFSKRITTAQAKAYGRNSKHAANQEAIANIIYGGAWGLKNLGNKRAGAGWLYRGRGLPQLTGERLYTWAGYAENPDAVADLKVSADIMVKAMRDGIFTGKKLADYLNDKTTNWVGCRYTVNGTDRAKDIAAYAEKFYAAWKAS